MPSLQTRCLARRFVSCSWFFNRDSVTVSNKHLRIQCILITTRCGWHRVAGHVRLYVYCGAFCMLKDLAPRQWHYSLIDKQHRCRSLRVVAAVRRAENISGAIHSGVLHRKHHQHIQTSDCSIKRFRLSDCFHQQLHQVLTNRILYEIRVRVCMCVRSRISSCWT